MWLIPSSSLVCSSSHRPSRPASHDPPRGLTPLPAQPTLQLPPVSGSPQPPGPIAVLGEVLRIGQYPSPTVILCAIAEAEALGRADLASDIVRVFVAPVVYQHWAAQGRPGFTPQPAAPYPPVPPTVAPYERGSCRVSCAPRPQDYGRGSCAPRHERGFCAPRSTVETAPVPQSAPLQVEPRQADNDEIFAMLHADPNAFISMVESQQARRGPVVEVFPVGTRPPTSAPDQPQMAPAPVPVAQQPGSSPEVSAHLQAAADQVANLQAVADQVATLQAADQFATLQAAADQVATLQAAAQQIRGMMPGSPIGGVPDDAWRHFVALLERESPTFSSSRHVGQYRQHRERLAALGIDPGAIQGSPVAQRMALDADLTDSYHHASAGGRHRVSRAADHRAGARGATADHAVRAPRRHPVRRARWGCWLAREVE